MTAQGAASQVPLNNLFIHCHLHWRRSLCEMLLHQRGSPCKMHLSLVFMAIKKSQGGQSALGNVRPFFPATVRGGTCFSLQYFFFQEAECLSSCCKSGLAHRKADTQLYNSLGDLWVELWFFGGGGFLPLKTKTHTYTAFWNGRHRGKLACLLLPLPFFSTEICPLS